MSKKQRYCRQFTEVCFDPQSLQELLKSYPILWNLAQTFSHGPMMWKVMQRNAWSNIANWRTAPLNSFSKSRLHALTTINLSKKKWDLLETCQKVCSQIVLKCMYLARIGRPDILCSVNKLLHAVTKWTRACDKRLARLISYIHHTSDNIQYCHVGSTAQHCR